MQPNPLLNATSEQARRKKLGVVYTPEQVAHYIAGQSIAAAMPEARLKNSSDPAISHVLSQYRGELRKYLPALRVLDPACGEGAFLLAVARVLYLLAVTTHGRDLASIKAETLREQIATQNLFGFDTDEQAVIRSHAAIMEWVQAGEGEPSGGKSPSLAGSSVAAIQQHVRVIDILDAPPAERFDIVVTNPPYVTMTSIPAPRKDRYAEQFVTYHANGDLYYVFLERAFSLLTEGGQLGAIVPRYFLKAPTAERLRGFLATKRCRAIDDLGQVTTFPGVGIHATLLFFENRPPVQGEVGILRVHPKRGEGTKAIIGQEITRQEKFDASELGAAPWTFFPPAYRRFKAQVLSRSAGYLGDFCILSKGVQTGKDSVFVVGEDTVTAQEIEAGALRPWLKGRDLHPYVVQQASMQKVIFSTIHEGAAMQSFPKAFAYLQEHKNELRQRSRVAEWYQWRKGDERVTLDWARPKIAGRYKGDRPIFSYDDSGAYFSQDVVLVQPKPDHERLLKFFLALLNSPVATRIAQYEFKELAYHTYEWYPQQLAKIPVILPPPEVLAHVDALVGVLRGVPDDARSIEKLDALMTDLYEGSGEGNPNSAN